MIRKFATIPGLDLFQYAILISVLGVTCVHAQQTPASQPSATPQPDQQSSSSQEASQEESTSSRRAKKHEYKKWTYNVGGGAGLMSGTTDTYVRSGGGVAAAGVAR